MPYIGQTPTKVPLTSDDIANGTITSLDLESSFLATVSSSAEIYGFSTDAAGHLIVTTTNSGADSITSATYATFKDVIYAGSGFSWSLVGTQLRATI